MEAESTYAPVRVAARAMPQLIWRWNHQQYRLWCLSKRHGLPRSGRRSLSCSPGRPLQHRPIFQLRMSST